MDAAATGVLAMLDKHAPLVYQRLQVHNDKSAMCVAHMALLSSQQLASLTACKIFPEGYGSIGCSSCPPDLG
jgi:hypothetical protein